jgi:hypothetical protein
MTPGKPTHSEIYDLLTTLTSKVDKLVDAVGKEAEDGASGTGLTGRIIRTEAKVHAYDKLKERATGAVIATPLFLAALWWLIKSKMAALFGTGG